MRVTLIHNTKEAHKPPVGWRIEPETEEDDKVIAIIRDLQFFGIDETHPEYDGLALKDENKGKVFGNIQSLSWVQQRHVGKEL